MSQGSYNYIDDIPMILSKKLHFPPSPSVPSQCVAIFFDISAILEHKFKYDYSLEMKVLEKLEEWKIKQSRMMGEREQRLIIKREEQRKKIEAEEIKLKEQLTQISYPSSDEISTSDEENNGVPRNNQQSNTFESVLTPTVVGSQFRNKISINRSSILNKISESSYNHIKHATKLELSDFENDAHDPFYTTELQTINDLDILAQVLNTLDKSQKSDYFDSNNEEQKKENEYKISDLSAERSVSNHQKIITEVQNKIIRPNETHCPKNTELICDNPIIYSKKKYSKEYEDSSFLIEEHSNPSPSFTIATKPNHSLIPRSKSVPDVARP